jgi:EAL domain-containing protein (putative c-di-GMP-specific phosphodiesterase class I)/GGDEF domain-containing protein
VPPLTTNDGHTLGAMCVLGEEPREISEQEKKVLSDLAAMVMTQIDLQHAVGRVEPITGCPNYVSFVEDVDDLAGDFPDSERSILSIELVDLEQVNTLQRLMGPAYLDELSRAAARKLRNHLGDSAKIYHVGPCQFAYIDTGNQADMRACASDLRRALLKIIVNGGAPLMLSPVVGIASVRLGRVKPDVALRYAHSACHDARVQEQEVGFYSESSDIRYQRRFSLIADFRRALEADDQLYLVYQPRIDLASGHCINAEALLRWRHPTLGNVSPAEFIPLVENTSMAKDLTDWVMRRAVEQTALWYRQGMQMRVSINIAAANLEEEDFTDRLLRHLNQESLPLTAIELELTESSLISNRNATRRKLEDLIARGIRIAIDDFGTGYSSLAYLQAIPAHVVKIDRSFVSALDEQPHSKTLVRSMISMAHELGFSVVGEGVEAPEGREILQALGCNEIQGYLISKPLTSADFTDWFQRTESPMLARQQA